MQINLSISRGVRRVIVAVLLFPFGTICLLFPVYYIFIGSLGNELLADTKGMIGMGTPTSFQDNRVSCTSHRSGTSRTGMTQWECYIDPDGGRRPRIKRTCAFNRTNKVPTLRIISNDPLQYAVSWGPLELFLRYLMVLGFPTLLVFGFGCACYYASYIGWTRP